LFSSLQLEGWRQFEKIEIDFHPHLTILTGANGSGKTTILNLLSQHFGWSIRFVSTPTRRKGGVLQFVSDLWSSLLRERPSNWIGEIAYDDFPPATIRLPEAVEAEFAVLLDNRPTLPGLYIPSHRPAYFHQPVTQISTKIEPREQLFQAYVNELTSRYSPNAYVRSPSLRIKEALVSYAAFGYGNQVIARDEEAVKTFEGFEGALRQVLPPSLGFEHLRVEIPEVVLETRTGRFSLDAVSGGVAALVT
jgi:energy-coupling factor transporter ATP-binding protein EcfA2